MINSQNFFVAKTVVRSPLLSNSVINNFEHVDCSSFIKLHDCMYDWKLQVIIHFHKQALYTHKTTADGGEFTFPKSSHFLCPVIIFLVSEFSYHQLYYIFIELLTMNLQHLITSKNFLEAQNVLRSSLLSNSLSSNFYHLDSVINPTLRLLCPFFCKRCCK